MRRSRDNSGFSGPPSHSSPTEASIRVMHAVKPASKPMNQPSQADIVNQTCEVCHIQLSAFCCNCKIPPAFLCDGRCFFEHQSKEPQIPHSILPISVAGRNPDEYQRKFNDLKQGTAELRRNVELMDQFGKELSASVDSAIEALRQFKDVKLQWLRKEKEQLSMVIEAAVKEAQACLARGTQPTTELAQKLWTLPSHQLPQVSYSLTPPDLRIISHWVHYSSEITPNQPANSSEKCAFCSRQINASEKSILACGHSCHSACTTSQQKCPICPEEEAVRHFYR